MTRHLRIAALILPLLLPALLTGKIVYERAHAPVYKVRIEGYDPRDLLYGHYLNFRYTIEDSRDKQSFPEGMDKIVETLPTRFYIDERYALAAENVLRDGTRVELGVGVPESGTAFIEKLYINDVVFEDAAK